MSKLTRRAERSARKRLGSAVERGILQAQLKTSFITARAGNSRRAERVLEHDREVRLDTRQARTDFGTADALAMFLARGVR